MKFPFLGAEHVIHSWRREEWGGGGGKERGSCQGLDAPLALTCPPVRLSQVLCHRIPVSLADAIGDFFSFFLAVMLVLVYFFYAFVYVAFDFFLLFSY